MQQFDLSAIPMDLVQELLFGADRIAMVKHSRLPIADHVKDFRAHLSSKRGDPGHVRQTIKYLRIVLGLCHISSWNQLDEVKIRKALDLLGRSRTKRKRGRGRRKAASTLGLATLNHYLVALKTFCNWMVDQHRAQRSPAKLIRPFNAETDPRHPRRPLTREEALRLVQAANVGKSIAGIPGHERAMMYVVAMTTGLRSDELQTLTRAKFKLDGSGSPHVLVHAAYAKGKRSESVPLRADVVKLLKAYLDDTARDSELFRRGSNPMRAFRADLKAAGIDYVVDGRYADFHATRHTFVTNLFDHAGCTPKEAQTLARHRDPRLTLRIYAHTTTTAQQAAVERLPSLASDPLKL